MLSREKKSKEKKKEQRQQTVDAVHTHTRSSK